MLRPVPGATRRRTHPYGLQNDEQKRRARRATSRILTPAAFVLLLTVCGAMLSGCLLQFQQPEIGLTIKEAYNENEILIPYVLFSEGQQAQARWTLNVYNPVEGVFELIQNREVRIPSGTSGVLELGALWEGRFEIVFELLTTRDGSYDPVPYLTQRRVFYVDRSAPVASAIGVEYYHDGGGPFADIMAGATNVSMVVYPPDANTDFESPVRVLHEVVYDFEETVGPFVPGEDEVSGPISLWNDVEPTVEVGLVAIDEAGNRSSLVYLTNGSWTAP